MTTENRICFRHGMRDGSPIALGYFAVAFTLGIAARNAGLSAIQALIASALNNASAGEYAGFALIAAGSSYLEPAIVICLPRDRRNFRHLRGAARISESMVRLRRHRGSDSRLGSRYFFRCNYGKCAADQSGQRFERRALWYVSGNHHSARQKKSGNCRCGGCRFCGEFPRKPPASV